MCFIPRVFGCQECTVFAVGLGLCEPARAAPGIRARRAPSASHGLSESLLTLGEAYGQSRRSNSYLAAELEKAKKELGQEVQVLRAS